MKSIEQLIKNLRHWADMASLTSKQVSVLSVEQLRDMADLLEIRNSLSENELAHHKVAVYEKLFGVLRPCPGESSIYSVGQHTHGCRPFYCLAGHYHISAYMFGQKITLSHAHSVTGEKNDA